MHRELYLMNSDILVNEASIEIFKKCVFEVQNYVTKI